RGCVSRSSAPARRAPGEKGGDAFPGIFQETRRPGPSGPRVIFMQTLSTPYYLIDKPALQRNLDIIDRVRRQSGAKVLLALKCFAAWSVFDLMRQHMDGTTSSSLYEVRLGREKFGGETHAYSVAYADHEIAEVVSHC